MFQAAFTRLINDGNDRELQLELASAKLDETVADASEREKAWSKALSEMERKVAQSAEQVRIQCMMRVHHTVGVEKKSAESEAEI